MFNAVLSDDGAYVLMFHEGEEEPEVMETYEFTSIYGTDVLENTHEVRPGEALLAAAAPESHEEDVEHYWKAFRRLVKNCGQYAHKVGLQRNMEDGILKVQKVAYKYFGGANSDRGLAYEIIALDSLRIAALANLDYWSRRVGFKPMSTPEDVKKYHLNKRADTEILLEHLAKPDFRKRIYYRIDKYARKGELKSPAEIVLEVLESFQKKSHGEPS